MGFPCHKIDTLTLARASPIVNFDVLCFWWIANLLSACARLINKLTFVNKILTHIYRQFNTSFFSKFFSHYNSHHCSHHSWWLIDDANHHKLFNSPFLLCRSHQWPSWRKLNKHQGQCQHQTTILIQIIPPIQQQTLQSCSDDADDGNHNHTQVKYWQWSNIKNSRQRKKSVWRKMLRT